MPISEPPVKEQWTFHKEEEAPPAQAAPQAPPPPEDLPPATWTASEFIAHHKEAGWYVALAAGVAALCGLIYALTHDLVSVVAIIVAVVLYLVISGGKPRQRTYTLDNRGISIDEKFYPYGSFKSFAVAQEGAIGCINLMPLKRLMPELSIYFAPQDGEHIIEILSRSLPNEQREERGTDRLLKKLHF